MDKWRQQADVTMDAFEPPRRAERSVNAFQAVVLYRMSGVYRHAAEQLREIDSFYVLDGTAELTVAGETFRAGPGSYVAAPAGMQHGPRNTGPGDLRMLNVHTPNAGFAQRLRAPRAAGGAHVAYDGRVEVLVAMRRRRMHRSFDPSPLDDRTLETLAWAATRAPAGGNQPSRYVLVVRDPRLVKTVVEVTPSYIGTMPPAIVAILTDTEAAESQMGVHGREQLSRTDAGAASEHVLLAAVDLGLGCYLFRSSNDAALRAALALPERVRVEALCAVGRPAATPSPAFKAPPQTVFLDTWGAAWEVTPP